MTELDVKVKFQALNFICDAGQRYIIALLVMTFICAWSVWGRVDTTIIVIWVLCSVLITLMRAGLIVGIRSDDKSKPRVELWGKILEASALLSGLLWGSSAVIFYVPESNPHQIFIFSTILSITSASVIILSYWITAFYFFTFPALAILLGQFLLIGDVEYLGFALITVVYGVVLMIVAKNQRDLALRSIRLGYQNVDLIAQLQQEKKTAEEANNSKSKFLAAASHDLRQPLHSIGLFSEALRYHIADDEALNIVNKINSSVDSLDNLLISLLDLSKLEAGGIKPKLVHFNLHSLLMRLQEEYVQRAEDKGLYLQLESPDVYVNADPTIIDIILRNLLSNAIRYTESGGIRLLALEQGDQVELSVQDSGVGISTDNQQKIFNEFFQVADQHNQNKGAGLGLSIVSRLVALMDYQLDTRSSLGVGSRFSFKLPLGNNVSEGDAVGMVETMPVNESVLVVDDSSDITESTDTLLTQWGYGVFTANTIQDALRLLSSQKIDILIIDYELSADETGLDVIKALPDDKLALLNVLFVSGEISQGKKEEIASFGYRCLQKPLSPSRLRANLIQLNRQKVVG